MYLLDAIDNASTGAITYVFITLNTILLALVGSFLKSTFSDFKEMKDKQAEHETKIALHEQKIGSLEIARLKTSQH